MELVKICRACLLPENRIRLLDWHQPIDSLDYVLSYKECFCKCTQINLNLKDDPNEKEDARTQFLCISCAQKLTDAYEFIEKARKSDNELRGLEVDRNFEWVSVNVKDVEKDNIMVENKNNHDMVTSTCEGRNPSIDETIKISDKIVQDVINNANLKKECNELEETASLTSENLVNEFDETVVDEDVKVASNENSFSKVLAWKKLQKKNVQRKNNTKISKNNLRREKKRGDDLVSCEICSKTMKRTTLKKHKQRHKPKTFLCQACPKTFNDSNALKTHELTHDENRERLPCDKCNQTFSSHYTFKKHMLTHDNNRKPQYKCTECQKSFLHKSGLIAHELIHKGAKLECNICQKRYIRQIDLEVHLRTHSGETPFICNLCGRSFNHKRLLNRHMQHHDGFFRYTCITCGEEFSKYDKYYTHRMKHTGLPYKCGICEKQFPDAYKMKRHITGVHKVYPDNEVKKLMVRVNDTKEYRGRIVEVLKDPDDIVNQNDG